MKLTTAIRELAKGKIIGRKFEGTDFEEYWAMVESEEDGDFIYRYIPSSKIEPVTSNLLLTKECVCKDVWYVCEDKKVIKFIDNLKKIGS